MGKISSEGAALELTLGRISDCSNLRLRFVWSNFFQKTMEMKGSKNKWYMQLTQNQSNLCELKAVQSWKCMDMSFVDFVDCVQKTGMQSFERCDLGMGMTTLQHCFGLFGDDAQSHLIQNLHLTVTSYWLEYWSFWQGKVPVRLGQEIEAPCSKQTYPQAFEATTRGASSSCQTAVSSKTLLATMPDGLRKVSITLLPNCITQEDGALLQFCLSLVLAGWGKLNPFFKWRVKKCQDFEIPHMEVVLLMPWDPSPLQAHFAIARWSFKKYGSGVF